MISDKDIQKLIEAQKRVFATKLELLSFKDELLKDFSDLQTSVDVYAKKADTYFQEMTMLTNKVDRHDRWIERGAKKLGIKIEY